MPENHPHVTCILLAYNQEHYVEEAARSLFAQDYRPLEIILSDDCSTDRTFSVLERLARDYRGPHRIAARRSERNGRMAVHLQQAIAASSGEFIILAAGDDVSMPWRARKLVERWNEVGRAPAVVYSDVEPVDCDGNPVPDRDYAYAGEHSLEAMTRGFVEAIGASTGFSRDLIERFGPIADDVLHEDRVLPFRALLLDGVVSRVDEPLVRYRAVGGVSRTACRDLKHYLREWSRQTNVRLLADAKQRLADLQYSARRTEALDKECRRTIKDHASRVAMSNAHWLMFEPVVLSHLIAGARPIPLLRHYLKFRIRWIIKDRVAAAYRALAAASN